MEIILNTDSNTAWTEIEGIKANVDYVIRDGKLDIRHTYVPAPLEGRGIASQLVKFVYDYALQEGLIPAATCPYAITWLKRHPEYNS